MVLPLSAYEILEKYLILWVSAALLKGIRWSRILLQSAAFTLANLSRKCDINGYSLTHRKLKLPTNKEYNLSYLKTPMQLYNNLSAALPLPGSHLLSGNARAAKRLPTFSVPANKLLAPSLPLDCHKGSN